MRRRYRSKITRKGQITLAAQARRDVGLKIGDAVDVIVDNGQIVGVEPASNWAERTYGIFKQAGPQLTDEELPADEEAWVAAAIERDERSKPGELSSE
jgi:AbrB family looped-hinge helix DNA binding protein